MRTNSECLLVVLVLFSGMAVLCFGEEQKHRQLSPEQELPAPTKLSDEQVEMLMQMSENHHYDDNNYKAEEEEEEVDEETANSSGFVRRRQLQPLQIEVTTNWYFTADFELHFYRKNGRNCFARHHDRIVSMMMDGLDEVVGRSRYAGQVQLVSNNEAVCREEDGVVRKLKGAAAVVAEAVKRYSESCRIIECELISEKLYFGIFVRYRRIPIVVVYRPR